MSRRYLNPCTVIKYNACNGVIILGQQLNEVHYESNVRITQTLIDQIFLYWHGFHLNQTFFIQNNVCITMTSESRTENVAVYVRFTSSLTFQLWETSSGHKYWKKWTDGVQNLDVRGIPGARLLSLSRKPLQL